MLPAIESTLDPLDMAVVTAHRLPSLPDHIAMLPHQLEVFLDQENNEHVSPHALHLAHSASSEKTESQGVLGSKGAR